MDQSNASNLWWLKLGNLSSLRWDCNVWLWVLRESDHWQIPLQITDPSSHQRGRPKMKNIAIVRQTKRKRKIWSWVPKGCPTPRWIGRLTVGHNINSRQLVTFVWKIFFVVVIYKHVYHIVAYIMQFTLETLAYYKYRLRNTFYVLSFIGRCYLIATCFGSIEPSSGKIHMILRKLLYRQRFHCFFRGG
jgi:hypothetical protein